MSEFAPGHLGRGGFNYYGTIGTNRDEFVMVRKMKNIDWLGGPRATPQVADMRMA